nr:MAG TPA: hypothetical protein [Caudoviricetes sp.]
MTFAAGRRLCTSRWSGSSGSWSGPPFASARGGNTLVVEGAGDLGGMVAPWREPW